MKFLNIILKLLKNLVLFYFPYILFLAVMVYKLNLFAQMTDTVFVTESFKEYLHLVFRWLTMGDEELLIQLRQGIVMVSTGAILLSSFWILLIPRRYQLISLFLLDLLLSFVIFADTVYFRYFEDVISSTVLLQIGQVGALGDSISNLFSIYDWLFFIELIILFPIVIYLLFKKPKINQSKKHLAIRLVNTLIVFSLGYLLVSFPIKVFIDKGGSYLFEKTISNMRLYEVTGLLGFHGYDLYKFVNEDVLNNHSISEEELNLIHDWFTDHQELIQNKTEFTGIAQGNNVIVIQAEAFENFLIDLNINGQEVTPNLNKLKEESLYFKNFYHQTGSGRTSDAEFLLNTSLHTLYTGSAYISYSGNTYTALPGILKNNGYETAVFHAYKKSFWNRYLMYPTLGFDTFYSLDTYEMDEPLGWSIADQSMLNQSFLRMTNLEEPFYSFLITLTSHHPYDIPNEYKDLDLDGISDPTFKNYLQSVHYVDKAIGLFIEQLKEAGLWDNSIFVIYGDHDSALMKEDNEVAEVLGIKNNKLKYYQLSDQVPLLVHLPNDKRAGVYEQVGGQIDLGPTILDLLGIKPEENYMMGSSLFSQQEQLVVFRNGSFTTDKVFYKASVDGIFENGICYDIESGAESTIESCRQGYEEVTQRLQISDNVLKGDLIRQFLNKEN